MEHKFKLGLSVKHINSLSAMAEYIRRFLKVTTSATAEYIRQNRFLTVDYSVRSDSPPDKIPDMSGPPNPT